MMEDRFEKIAEELERARRRFLVDIDRLQHELRTSMSVSRLSTNGGERLDDEFAAAREASEIGMERIRRILDLARRRRNRRYDDDDDGGELMPVEPRPNPSPLIDGAEAPLE